MIKIKLNDMYFILTIAVLLMSCIANEIHFRVYYSVMQAICSGLLFIFLLIFFKDETQKKELINNIRRNKTVIIILSLMIINTIFGYLIYEFNTLSSIIQVVIFFYTTIVIFFIFPLLCENNSKYEKLVFNFIIVFTSILSFFSILQKIVNPNLFGYHLVHARYSSIFFDPNFLAAVLGCGLFVTLTRKWNNAIKIILACMYVYAVYLSGSRGTLLSILITLYLYFIIFSKMKFFKKIIVTIILTFFSICLYNYLNENTSFLRLYQGDNYRSEMIAYALKGSLKSPIFGYGYQSISGYLKTIGSDAGTHSSTHNSYIDFLFGYGYITTCIYISFIIRLLLRALKCKKKQLNTYIICSIFMLMNANTILYSFGGVGITSILLTLMLGLLDNYSYEREDKSEI